MSTIIGHETTYDFPKKSSDASTQTTKINKHQLLLNEASKIPTKISKIMYFSPTEIKNNSSDKTDHQSLLKLKKHIQTLIDFQSPRIVLIEIPTNDFDKHLHISQNFQLIKLDGEPIPDLMLCKKCNQVRARCRLTSTPIVRHLKLHEQAQMARNFEQKKKGNNKKNNNGLLYAACLTHAMKNSLPISNAGQEYGEVLTHAQRRAIVKMVLSQGDQEGQITLGKNLKRDLWNKINRENSEQKKKKLYKELKSIEWLISDARNQCGDKAPIGEQRLASHAYSKQVKTKQAMNLENNVLPIAEPCASSSSVPKNLTTQEMNEDDGMEIRSMTPAANDEPIKSVSQNADNEIKLEICND